MVEKFEKPKLISGFRDLGRSSHKHWIGLPAKVEKLNESINRARARKVQTLPKSKSVLMIVVLIVARQIVVEPPTQSTYQFLTLF